MPKEGYILAINMAAEEGRGETYRVLVMGDSYTGKTTFLRLLQGGDEGLDRKERDCIKPTYGCDVHIYFQQSTCFEFYELGGTQFDSEANRAILTQPYHGYMLFFDANNAKSLSNIRLHVEAMKRANTGDYLSLLMHGNTH